LKLYRKYKFLFRFLKKRHKVGIVLSSGRNFQGRICVQHQGSAIKNKYLKIDRFRHLNQKGKVCRVLDHFFFSGFVGLIIYFNGLASFILLSEGLKIGSYVFSGFSYYKVGLGSTSSFFDVKLFDPINSVEYFPFSGSKIARSAGVFSYLFFKNYKQVIMKMPSGWQLKLSPYSSGVLGIVSNPAFFLFNFKKAGFSRNLGIRPSVRGVAKNPCDHPHGGGEGRGSPPVAQVSP